MKRLFLLFSLFPLLLAAGIKLDIDGRSAGMTLKGGACSPRMSYQHPAWAKSKGYMLFTRGANAAWGKYFFTFVADKDGVLTISRRGVSSKRGVNHWMIYKEVKISGAELVFHAASKAAVKGLAAGEERCGHFHAVIDYVKVKANVPVKVEFMARREGTRPENLYTQEEYKLPVPVAETLLSMRFTVNGLAAKIPVDMPSCGKGFVRKDHTMTFGGERGRIDLFTPRFLNKNWKKLSFTFTPRRSGILSLARCNAANLRGVAQWIEFRNFHVEGAEMLFSPRSKVHKGASGWERMAFKAPLYDDIRVQKDKPVTVTFEARTAASEPESAYGRRDWWHLPQKYKTAWQDNKIQLLAKEDLGCSFAFYGEGQNVLNGEKARLVKPEDPTKPQMRFSVPVEVLEEEGIPRNAVIRFGFPLPEKSFRNVGHLAVFDADGKKIPADIHAAGFWGDGSVKWALIEFETTLKAREKRFFTVKGGADITPAPGKSPVVKRAGKKYMISAGRLSGEIDPDADTLLENIVCDGKKFGSLKLRAGQNARSRLFKVTRESASVIRLDGGLFSDSYAGGFTVRLGFAGNTPQLRAAVTFRADNMAREINELTSLHLELVSGKGRLLSGGIFQGNDKSFILNGKTFRGFMPDADVFQSPQGKVSFALADAGKRYPKAFAVNAGGLDIQLLPPQPSEEFNSSLPGYLRFPYMAGKYRLMTGMNFTEELVFDFSGAPVSAQEIIAVIPASWHARANAVRGVFADDTVKMFDDHAVKAFYDHLKLKAHQREYGFLNFGDWFGERGGNWGNNEYDFAYGLLTLFARTGNRDIYRWGIRAARHQSDVDIIHATPYWNHLGGNYMHCVGHAGRRSEPGNKPVPWFGGMDRQGYAAATNGHSWSGGMFLAFLMSGRSDIGDSALALAGQFLLHAGTPYRNQGNPRSHGWMLEGLMQAYDATGNRKYLDAARLVADGFFKCQALDKGGAWPHDLPAGYLRGGRKKGFGAACFQMGVVIQALHHYALRANRPEIRKNMAAAAGWMRKAFIPGAIGWPYVAGWDASAYWAPNSNLNMLMLAAAAADGDPAGELVLLNGIGLYMMRGVGSRGIGKNLAMDLVFAPAAFEILKNMPGKRKISPRTFINSFSKVPHLMRLRGPEQMNLSLRLRQEQVTLFFERLFYNPRKNKVKNFQVTVRDSSGRTVWSFKGDVNDRRDIRRSCVLRGRPGEKFDISITDNISSYWDVYTSDRSPVLVHLTASSQFSNGVSLFFGVRVPAGVKKFTVKYTGCHLGEYGIAAVDKKGEIVQMRSRYNTKLQLPWLKDAGSSRCDLVIERKDFSNGGYYRFFTWSGGDILLDLEGVPRVLEFVR